MRFPYEGTHEPPAPFLDIQIEHPTQPQRVAQLYAKVDTGADISVIPLSVAQALGLEVAGEVSAMGFNRQVNTYTVYITRLIFPSGQRAHVHVLATVSDETVLGRDVLNHFRLLLDGPALTLEILNQV
ncbi:MAG: retroviral-like aspartic protease family protein [Anaerolineales bacterium]